VASRGERARGREDGVEIMRLGAGIFIALHPTTPGLLLFPMLYVNCTVKSHYIRAQCVHYTPRQKHFYPLEFFLLPPRPPLPLPPLAFLPALRCCFFFSGPPFGAKRPPNLFARATRGGLICLNWKATSGLPPATRIR
jgi:hypothetical protein